jgi:hypothetical protein
MVLKAIVATGSNETDARSLLSIIMGVAPEGARHELEKLIMSTTEYRLHFLDREIERASAAARAEGRAIGEAEGRTRGEAEGEAAALLKILRFRGIELSDEQREIVASSSDPVQVDLWLDRALTASSTEDIFKD